MSRFMLYMYNERYTFHLINFNKKGDISNHQKSHNRTFLRTLNLSQSRILFIKVYDFDTLWSLPFLDKFMTLTNGVAELTPVE